tara:strand:+ start:532 stop:861 length:330 start_codon:yes stop_codon:yes gene_type:complete
MKGFIYTIRDLNSDKIYVGSSKKLRLQDRISDHLYSYKHKRCINSRLIFDGGNWEAEIIDNLEFNDPFDLLLLEQAYMDDIGYDYHLVNGQRAVRHNHPKLMENLHNLN